MVASEIVFNEPGLFNNYIIISPSLWWDNESLLANGPIRLNKQSISEEHQVYISVGTEGKQMEADAKRLAGILKQQKGFKVVFAPLPKESHLTILHQSIYNAILAKATQ